MCYIVRKWAKHRTRAAPPWGALFFGSFPRNLNQGRETHANSRGRKNAPSVEKDHRREPADQKNVSGLPPEGFARFPCGATPESPRGQAVSPPQAGRRSFLRDDQQEGDPASGLQD